MSTKPPKPDQLSEVDRTQMKSRQQSNSQEKQLELETGGQQQQQHQVGETKKTKQLDEEQQQSSASRPRRRATNQHIFRYLQTRNPTKLEENDLKRALEASLEECPDFWPIEDTASCSSSEQSNATTTTSSSTSSGNSIEGNTSSANTLCNRNNKRCMSSNKRKSHSMQHNHLNRNCSNSPNNHNHQMNQHHLTACCPLSSVHNRYKPVAKKNIYDEADFFHEGIMEYIAYELVVSWANKKRKNKH